MGRIFVVELEGRSYRCKFCKTHLALADDVVSRNFHCRRGKAYLFSNVANTTIGPLEERMMLSGMHTVADIFCCCCGQIVGWKYESAHEKSQKYKEGKFVLERGRIVDGLDSEFYIDTRPGTSDAEDAHRKKKSRKSKSKKLRRHDDSVSSYSDDEPSSSLSVSSSSSDDDYKSRKSRLRTRGDVKGSRKRGRRSSSCHDSSLDSPRVKKKKRNGDSESRKKRSKKKKKKKKKRRRDSSISSYSSDNVYDDTTELFSVENNSRRLKSVITILTRETESEGNVEDKDEFKEEIVYDHDDYPSSKSNDSNEAGNKKELGHREKENVTIEEPSVTNLEASEPMLTSKNGSDKYDELECSFDGAGNVSPKEKESDVKDFELILRQRALENLKKFRGGNQMNEVFVPVDERNKSNNEMKLQSNVETGLVPNKRAVESQKRTRRGSQINEVVPFDEGSKSSNEMKMLSTGEAKIVQYNQLKQEDPDIMGASESAVRRSRFTWRRDSSLPTGTEEKIYPKKYDGLDSAATKLTDATLPESEEKARNVRPLASRLQTLPRENLSLIDSVSKSENKMADGDTETLGESNGNMPSSGLAEEGSSREPQNDSKDGSQFEQKKMTVMSGGELVEVSYKVYIPKKVPALARRQLKR